jgi:hypothetical protein
MKVSIYRHGFLFEIEIGGKIEKSKNGRAHRVSGHPSHCLS